MPNNHPSKTPANEPHTVPPGKETYPRCGHARSYHRWNYDLPCPCGD